MQIRIAATHTLNATGFWINNQNAYFSLMEKVKKYLSSFKNTLLFSFLPVLAVSNFYSEDAPDVWDYAIAPVLPLIFIIILVTDIMAYRKANKELEED